MPTSAQLEVIEYYNKRESRLGYRFLLHGTRHFGYYPPNTHFSIAQAQRKMEDRLGETLGLPRKSVVLDAGCGEGFVAQRMAERFHLRVLGVDLHTPSITLAQRSAQARPNRDITFVQGDYARLPFASASFDGAYTMETLVHAADPIVALKEINRVLKPGGKLVLFEYSIAPPSMRTRAQERIWHGIAVGSAMHSLTNFEHGRFPDILTRAGFLGVSVDDITEATLPMLRMFYRMAWLPYQFVRLLRLERRFANTAAAAALYKDIVQSGAWRYNVVTATKAGGKHTGDLLATHR